MALGPEERERLLAGLPENIRLPVEARLAEVAMVEDGVALVRAVEIDEQLRPLAARVQSGDRDAFDMLWDILKPRLRGVIRASIRCYGNDHFDEVESRVMTTLWDKRGEFDKASGFYLTWARSIARNLARWYRPDGARSVELHDDHAVPPNVELPPSACFAEELKLVQDQDPHYALAFLFNKYLGWRPEAIAERLSDLALPEVLNLLEREVISQYPALRGFGVFLTPLRKRIEGNDQTLSSFVSDGMTLSAAVSHWATDAVRRVCKRVLWQAHSLLELACRLRAPSYERLSFLWCRFLQRTVASLASLRGRLVMDILNMFCTAYLPLTDLPAEEIDKAVLPLRNQIFPKQTLAECGREDLSLEIARWRDRIQAMLLGPVRSEHLVAYAYLCGYLPALTGPARNNKKEGGSNDAVRKSSAHG